MLVRPKKILVIKLRSLGDTVLMTATLDRLKDRWPDAAVHVLVMDDWAPLFRSDPRVAKVWTYVRHPHSAARAKAVARLALPLFREKFDAVINLHASPSSSTLAFATRAPVRSIHFHGHQHNNRYSTVEIAGKGVVKPIIERDLDALRALEVPIAEGRMLPRLPLHPAEQEEARDRLDLLGMRAPTLAIGIGASRTTKCWPVERFARVAFEWCRDRSGSAITFVGPGEENLGHDFLKAFDGILSVEVESAAERSLIRSQVTVESGLPLRLLASLLSMCLAFVGNDSGPKHLAVAVGTPTVTLFGPEDPFEWHPYPQDRHPRLFIEGLACRKDALPGYPAWCGLDVCVEQKHRCMLDIGVVDVMREVLRVTA